MDNLEKQIQDFWENRTSAEQRREILRQLDESGMEWREFLLQYYNKILAGEETNGLGDEQKSRVWQRLKDQHLSEGKVVERRIAWLPWMAAASVLLVVGLFMYQGERKPAKKKTFISEQPATAAVKLIVTKNTGTKEDSLTLPDHSIVLLAPGSTIRYPDPFEARARTIQLEGRALFEVAKDSLKPFTVTAQGFATTALGTRFIVDATRPVVSIRLLKGKIVVNAMADAGIALQKMYLVPGQELRINTTTKRFDRLAADIKPDHNKVIVSGAGVTRLSFERTSLASVFQRLSAYYKISILYNKAEVQGLSFTGDFKPTDELDLALKVICGMNQLTFTKENNHIIITK